MRHKNWLSTLAFAALAGCSVRNATPYQMSDVRIPATFDAAWQGTVAYFADARIPIATIDKSSGLIASREVALTKDQMIKWLDCGDLGGKSQAKNLAENWNLNAIVDFNVFLRPMADSTAARVNLTVNAKSNTLFAKNAKAECESSGVFEKTLVTQVTESARAGSKRE
jgi:hypothetical protein